MTCGSSGPTEPPRGCYDCGNDDGPHDGLCSDCLEPLTDE